MSDATGNSSAAASQSHPVIPEDATIILPIRNTLLFPGIVLPLTIARPSSIAAVQEAVRGARKIGLLLQDDPNIEQPEPEQLRRVGTIAEILRYVTSEQTHYVICRGLRRFRVQEFLPGYPFLIARVKEIGVSEVITPEIEARMRLLKMRARDAIQLLPDLPQEIGPAIEGLDSPSALADFLAGIIDIPVAEKQDLLETFDVTQLLDKLLGLLAKRIQVLQLSKQIGEQTEQTLSSQQREHILREQLRQIQKELGDDDPKSAELKELGEKIDKAGMPKDAEEQARRELKRLERLPEIAAEYGMVRSYLEWLVELPWSKCDPERIDIDAARQILEEDHYGIEKVKRRILEYLAVRKLNPEGKSPILCFVGPPGVGKTSLGQSIARATDRKFVRLSLGGVHDESEIRGHRRTYVGALPGNIIQSINKAGTRNPVMMLDEMDKLGVGFHGDPAAALLEVLDPEQNATFRDNYLAVPFDLSSVLFIGTANVLDNIPPAVRDRMEVIEMPGYIEDEKLAIAKRYLIKRQLASAGLSEEQCQVEDDVMRAIIRDYTREAGVRSLERRIGAICRHAAMRIAEGKSTRVVIAMADLQGILGPKRYEPETAMRTSVPGVATGLAWTPAGGDILFVEATSIPGRGKLILTGQLGDVMKESAQAALTLVKSRAAEFGIDTKKLQKADVHVHVPAGAIPKDGPSAGVAMFMALTSLLTGRTVRSDTAMTGEISLRGLVLPIGGVKEKVLAAIQAGIATVMLPARNRKDIEDVPEKARNQIRFIWLERVDEAIEAALNPSQTDQQDLPRTTHATTTERRAARSR
ncbi:ATP-dependent Lon protease [Bradyrhizobium elkanii]|uniref:endopeptidase La n=1 Tax=Bradyrhizobium TaxID=374 RepID=UPI00216A67C6|nr:MULTISPECIES: endopeptidase La [Bradyrhizobium]MCS3928952.1 ATP-dependent Lon protease [Bradyrhizobium elkanii]MCS3969508.1 ATP-dependent Lon protease [Bradyrhizobium japonicum]